MTASWRELVHEIRVDPDGDGPRLVAADWLSERGDPRGEYIVLACRRASEELPWEQRQRFDEIENEHIESWSAPLSALGLELLYGSRAFNYERGFVDYASLRAGATRNFAAICELEPITRLHVMQQLRALARMPELAYVRSLSAAGPFDDFLASPHLANVEDLSFGVDFSVRAAAMLGATRLRPKHLQCVLDAEIIEVLVRDDVLVNLAGLSRFQVTDDMLVALSKAELRHFTKLELFDPRVTIDGLAALRVQLDRLTTFAYCAPFGGEFARELARSFDGGALRELDLRCSGFIDDGPIAMLDAPACKNVETLALGDDRVSPELAAAITRLAAHGRLRRLAVPRCELTLPGVEILKT